MRNAVVVTAAGNSVRFNLSSSFGKKKEFANLNGHSVLYNSVKPFTEIESVDTVAVTYSEGSLEETKACLEDLILRKRFLFVQGGSTRQKSVFNALKELEKQSDFDFVMIHDGARPFISGKLILNVLAAAEEKGASAPALCLRDTVVKTDDRGFIAGRVDRNTLRAVQTPQIFPFTQILSSHERAYRDGLEFTDDTQVFTYYSKSVFLIPGDYANIKITFAEDLAR